MSLLHTGTQRRLSPGTGINSPPSFFRRSQYAEEERGRALALWGESNGIAMQTGFDWSGPEDGRELGARRPVPVRPVESGRPAFRLPIPAFSSGHDLSLSRPALCASPLPLCMRCRGQSERLNTLPLASVYRKFSTLVDVCAAYKDHTHDWS